MTRKEKVELLLSKVPGDQKEAFVAALRETRSKEDRTELFRKYSLTFSEEEKAKLKEVPSSEVTDEELDQAAGGCCESCASCDCQIYCGH